MQTPGDHATDLEYQQEERDLRDKLVAVRAEIEYERKIVDLHEKLAAVSARLENSMGERAKLQEDNQVAQRNLSVARAEIDRLRKYRRS